MEWVEFTKIHHLLLVYCKLQWFMQACHPILVLCEFHKGHSCLMTWGWQILIYFSWAPLPCYGYIDPWDHYLAHYLTSSDMNSSTVVLWKRAHYGLSAHPQFSLDFLLRSKTYLNQKCKMNLFFAIDANIFYTVVVVCYITLFENIFHCNKNYS